MRLDVFTLVPAAFDWIRERRPLAAVLGNELELRVFNYRDSTPLSAGQVDDDPYGGGPGMVLRVDVVAAALDAAYGGAPDHRVVALSPQGRQLDQELVEELALEPALTLLSARFEGFDQRILDHLCTDVVSIGPYVLSGGEIPALALVDAVARRLPGALTEGSGEVESFSAALNGGLEYPHYTRPAEFRGWTVPEILLSGDHGRIDTWRREQVQERVVSDTEERAHGERPTSGGCRASTGRRLLPRPRSRGRCRLRRPRDTEQHHEFHHPLDRVTGRLPRRLRIAVDWIVTIVGAVAIVLAIKAWVVNPYRIPSSSMESTLHCARPAPGCESRFSDRVLANRFVYHFRDPERGDVIVFETPPAAQAKCGAGGTFVKRIVGLPGERVGDSAAPRRGVRLHRRKAARGAVHRERPPRHRPGGRRTACPPVTTSSWATTARSRATRACGAPCPRTT